MEHRRELRRIKKLAEDMGTADERRSTQMEETGGEPMDETAICSLQEPPTEKNLTIEPEKSPPPVKLNPKQAFRAAVDQWVSHRLDHLGERLE